MTKREYALLGGVAAVVFVGLALISYEAAKTRVHHPRSNAPEAA